MTILDREVQFENARLPIRVTLSGITILDREVQLEYLQLIVFQLILF